MPILLGHPEIPNQTPVGDELESCLYSELLVFAGLIARQRAKGYVVAPLHADLLRAWAQVSRELIIGEGFSAFDRTTMRKAAIRYLEGCQGAK